MTDRTYDLRDQPFVRVHDGSRVRDVPLREAFSRAHEISSLAGEMVTQDAAMLRIMLAILHRVIGAPLGYPTDAWAALWRAATLPVQRIDAYLDQLRDRFDLFHARTPFLQVADLTAAKNSGLIKLVGDVPDGYQYFTVRGGSQLDRLKPAEAARWLVHCQAYDPSGIKTGAEGDPRVKGGKGYPIGTAWSGRCGLIILEGSTLKETLLLNLVIGLGDSDDEPDLPVWERPPLGPGEDRRHPEPLGPADMMTWPARRVRLHREGDMVSEVLLCNGDPIHQRNRQRVETMTAFRRSANQEKKYGVPTYMPVQHDPDRKLWRGLHAVLAQRPHLGAVGNDAPDWLPPANVAWLAQLTEAGALPRDYPVVMRSVGMRYGTQDASVFTDVCDELRLSAAVASDDDLRSEALSAATVGDGAAYQAGLLAENLAAAAGRGVAGPREAARLEAYNIVGRAYAEWLTQLTPDCAIEESRFQWHATVRRLLLGLGRTLLDDAAQASWTGREVRSRHVDAALAWQWFLTALGKTLDSIPSTETMEGQAVR